jgi:hypothetical protein
MSRALLAAVIVVTAACATTADTSTTSLATTCEDPPADEVAAESDLAMTVSPNPAQPREVVELTVAQAGFPEDSVVGVDAKWQCWDGSAWVTTHIVYRGFGNNAGQTIAVNAEFQIRVPSIGLALDEGYPIVIPQVELGLYRIADEAIVEDESIHGFTLVEVIEN